MAINMAVNNNNVIPLPTRRGLFARLNAVKDNLAASITTKINKETLGMAAEKLTQSVQTSVQKIANHISENKGMMAASAATGFLAKLAVGAAVTASGGSLLLIGVAGAAASGAAVGLLKSYVDYKKEAAYQPKTKLFAEYQPKVTNKFWTLKTLKNTVSGAAMSTATFGAFDVIERMTGVNVGQSIFDMAGRGLSATFNAASRVAEIAQEKIIAAVANTDLYKQALASTLRNYNFANSLNAATGKINYDMKFTPTRDVVGSTPVTGTHTGIDNATRQAAFDKVRAWEATQVKAAPVSAPALVAAASAGAEGRTLLETAIGDDAAMNVARAMPDVQMPDPSKPVEIEIKTADGETTIIKAPPMPNMSAEYAIAQKALNDDYVAERLRDVILRTTGQLPADNMSALEMAKEIVPNNPKAYLETLALEAADKAVKLDPSKMAAACVTDLPKTAESLAAQGHVLPNTCAIAKDMAEMAEGDYVVVRDAAEPAPTAKRGIRALFKQAIAGTAEQLKEKTADFIDKVVAGYAVPEMSAEKIALASAGSVEQSQLLAMAPNP